MGAPRASRRARPAVGSRLSARDAESGDERRFRSWCRTSRGADRGRVLPIGGVKEKLLGAVRAGIRTVVLPKENVPDLEDLPQDVRDGLEIVPVQDLSEALAVSLRGHVKDGQLLFTDEVAGGPKIVVTAQGIDFVVVAPSAGRELTSSPYSGGPAPHHGLRPSRSPFVTCTEIGSAA
ncbi:MAG TPA: S16 family serine protease [Thermoanaerobaculia bacterium]|nr:S16 family serine protease [Thermoanaerobaculia bacterium]